MRRFKFYLQQPLLVIAMQLVVGCLFFVNPAKGQTADFTIDNATGCAPLTANFTDISSGGTVVSRVWDLGSGPIANTAVTVGANYNNPGTSVIVLRVTFDNGAVRIATKNVVAYPKPVANFTASDSVGCPAFAVQFTNTSTTATGSITSSNWSFGAGSSNAANPLFTFNTTGLYTVSLFVENNWGCRSDAFTKSQYIQVLDKPNAAFSIVDNSNCDLPFTPVFNNTTTGGGTIVYNWTFGDGGTATAATPTHTYTSYGVFNVNLTASNGANTSCNSNATAQTVYLGKPPITPVLATPAATCTNTNNTYTINGILPAALLQSVSWNWGDGNTSTSGGNTNSYSYATDGNFTITATINYRSGCTDVVTQTVNVSPKPLLTCTAVPSRACKLPFTVSFNAVATPANPNYVYTWNFGDGGTATGVGLTAPTHTYTTVGNRNATVTVTDPNNPLAICNSTTTSVNVQVALPYIDIYSYSPATGCLPMYTTFNAYIYDLVTPIANVQVTWNFGDGSAPVVQTPNSLNTSIGHLYTAIGSYTVTVSFLTPEGCTQQDQVVVVVNDCNGGNGGGNGGFSDNGGTCNNRLLYTFTAITIPGTTVTSWNFGDPASGANNTAGAVSPVTHLFTSTGTFRVTITRQVTATGQTLITYRDLVVTNNPIVAAFTSNATATCPGVPLNFTPQGINPDQVFSYTWTFGDGTPSVTLFNTNPPQAPITGATTHNYVANGSFPATLTVLDRNGCSFSTQVPTTITVNGPAADFTANILSSCDRSFTVTFTNSSTPINASAPLNEWIWDFGDGSTQTVAAGDPITHTYTNNLAYRTYTVSLKVKDVNGCESPAKVRTAYIKAYQPDAAFFVIDTLRCNNYNFGFYNSSNAQGNPTAPTTKFVWNYGDGQTFATNSPAYSTHTYAADGQYTITLKVTDENGCVDSASRNNYIRIVKPRADFVPGSAINQCAPISLDFINQSQTFGQPTTYSWTFGNGGTGSTLSTPQPVIYPIPNDYTVKLIVRALGCVDSISKQINVKGPRGVLNFPGGNGCIPYNLNMSVTGSNISSYAWDFNDGTPVAPSPTQSSIAHIYTAAGIYNPNVILSSPEGCRFTLRPPTAIIVDSAKAKMMLDNIVFCGTATVSFTNQSTVPSFSAITNQQWDFGDGTNFNGALPLPHTYSSAGVFPVSLAISSRYGCRDTARAVVTVNNLPRATIIGHGVICLQPDTRLRYKAIVTSIDPVVHYEWKLNGNIVGNDADSLSIDFRTPGRHLLSVRVSTNLNCDTFIERTVIIDSAKAGFTVNRNQLCGSNIVTFNNISGSGFANPRFTWNFDDGSGSTSLDSANTHTYQQIGLYTPSVLMVTENGCRDSFRLPTPIRIYAVPQLSIAGIGEICMNNSLTYIANAISEDSIIDRTWALNGNVIGNDTAVTYNFTQAGNYVLTYTINTRNGCRQFATKNIIIRPLPVPAVSPRSTTICEQTNLTLNANDGTDYVWTPNTGIVSGANTANPIVSPANNTQYFVRVTNQYGCQQIDSAMVRIDRRVKLVFGTNATICIGDSVRLTASGNTNQFNWSPATGLSDANIANPMAKPQQTTTYIVTGVSQNVCPSETGSVTIVVGNYPTVDLGADLTLTAGQTYNFNPTLSSDVTTYQWRPTTGLNCSGCRNPQFIADRDIQYTLTVGNQYGCKTTDTVKVKVLCNKGSIFMPNAFTPNGDGKNDRFFVAGWGIKKVQRFTIFDRFGQVVFTRSNVDAGDPSAGWDGSLNNQQNQISNVYVYIG
jgi:gliding motility-associated-like protein